MNCNNSECGKEKIICRHGGNSEALYGLGVVGALFYFLQNASGVSAVLIGILKAIFWPAMVVFKVLTNLGV